MLKRSGYSFLIDFSEIDFDPSKDLIGSSCINGEVYGGQWLGVKVAIKKQAKIYQTKKAGKSSTHQKEFLEEIKVMQGLRHPNIMLFMGVTFDESQSFYLITE